MEVLKKRCLFRRGKPSVHLVFLGTEFPRLARKTTRIPSRLRSLGAYNNREGSLAPIPYVRKEFIQFPLAEGPSL